MQALMATPNIDEKPVLRKATLVLALALVMPLVFLFTYSNWKQLSLNDAVQRLTLYERSVQNEVEKARSLSFHIGKQANIVNILQSGRSAVALREDIRRLSAPVDGGDIYLFDKMGQFLGKSSRSDEPQPAQIEETARNYFSAFAAGATYSFLEFDAETGDPCYFSLTAVTDLNGSVLGVVAIALPLGTLEKSWAHPSQKIFVTDENGVVVLSSDPDWRRQNISGIQDASVVAPSDGNLWHGEPTEALPIVNARSEEVKFFGQRHFYVHDRIDGQRWDIHYLVPDDIVHGTAIAYTLLAMAFVLMIWVVLNQNNARLVTEQLKRKQRDLLLFQSLNTKLESEINERNAAEKELKDAQHQLERANKLAALGQLASSVTHELGQPITAIRSYLTAVEISGGTLENSNTLPKLQSLAERMQKILEELKFFARPAPIKLENIEVGRSLTASLDLLRPNIVNADVTVRVTQDKSPKCVCGDRTRLEQVFTNIIRNAIDVMAETDHRELEIQVEAQSNRILIRFMDQGPGFGDISLDTLTEPFYTTRASGNGMGLGLAITAEIVKEHRGYLMALNREGRGAVMAVSLPLYVSEGYHG